MRNVLTMIVAAMLCAGGYATDFKNVTKTRKLDALSLIAIQQMEQAKESTSQAKGFGGTSTASTGSKRITATVQMKEGATIDQLKAHGFSNSTVLVGSYNIVTTTIDSLQVLAEMQDVVRISFDKKEMNLNLTNANKTTGVDLIHKGKSTETTNRNLYFTLDRPYTGKGVMIGIFDSGFDPNHAMFLDKDGKSRFKMIIKENGTAITDPEEIANYTTDDRYTAHATNVSGIAAGYYEGDNFQLSGVAPEADLAMGPIMSSASDLVALKTLAEYCKEKGERLVTNMSYGNMIGPHDGSDLYSQVLNDLIKEYDIIACNSVGNCGDQVLVHKHNFSSNTDEMKAIWGIDSDNHEIRSYITTSTDAPINMEIIVANYKDQCKTIFAKYPIIINGEPTTLKINDEYIASTTINIAKETIHDGLMGYAINSNGVWYTKDEYRIGYIITSAEGQKVVVYNDTNLPFKTVYPDYTDGLTSNGTFNSTSSASEMLVVGAYITTTEINSKSNGAIKVTNKKGTWGTQEGDIAYFSSYGTRYDGIQFPCIAAPGACIESAYNRYVTYYSGKKCMTKTDTYKGKEYSFCAMKGTSQASPYMAGVAALWLEANPNLTHEEIKEIAQKTANNDSYCKEENYFAAQGKQAGAGKINALAGLEYILNDNIVLLDEDEAIPSEISGKKNVVLKRTLVPNIYNTVVLPFSMTEEQITSTFGTDTKVYTFNAYSKDEMTFHRAHSIEANRPFLMQTSTTESTFNIKDVTIEEESTPVDEGLYYNFKGYYGEPTNLAKGMYFIYNGMLYSSEGNSFMKGYRAYFEPKSNTNGAKVVAMNIDGKTTSINMLETSKRNTSSCAIYHINGQKISENQKKNLSKGIYIQNGKKYVIR